MTLEEVIRMQLLNFAPLAALIGTRIYPITYPQDAALPVVVYQRTSGVSEYGHDGPGSAESRFQISAFGKTYAEARQTATQVRRALNPWEVHQDTIGGNLIGGCFLENELDLFNPAGAESESDYQVLGDYLFLHAEA